MSAGWADTYYIWYASAMMRPYRSLFPDVASRPFLDDSMHNDLPRSFDTVFEGHLWLSTDPKL